MSNATLMQNFDLYERVAIDGYADEVAEEVRKASLKVFGHIGGVDSPEKIADEVAERARREAAKAEAACFIAAKEEGEAALTALKLMR